MHAWSNFSELMPFGTDSFAELMPIGMGSSQESKLCLLARLASGWLLPFGVGKVIANMMLFML